MLIKNMKITDIFPYEKNPRINDNAVDAVVNSIKEFGWRAPIVVDKDMVIICGHTRLKAAIKLGLTEVPVHVATDLTPEQVKAYRIADNKTGEIAEWDFNILPNELLDLQNADFDLSCLGFNADELNQLLNGDVNETNVAGETDPEAIPEVPEDATSKFGKIYQLGNHRLMCGDSTKTEDVAKLMQGELADLWLTDPPYNVAYTGKTAEELTIQNDSMDDSTFKKFLIDAFNAAKEHIKPGGAFYIWHADIEGYNFRSAVKEVGLKVRQCLIWVKNTIVIGRQDYQWKHEPCLYGWIDGAGHYFTPARNLPTVIDNKPNINQMNREELKNLCKQLLEPQNETSILYEDKPARNGEHPTMKPIKLFARQITNSSKEGEIVLDTFGGSGTTIIACEQLNRQARLMELDPHYCDIIRRRWAEFRYGEGCDWQTKTPEVK